MRTTGDPKCGPTPTIYTYNLISRRAACFHLAKLERPVEFGQRALGLAGEFKSSEFKSCEFESECERAPLASLLHCARDLNGRLEAKQPAGRRRQSQNLARRRGRARASTCSLCERASQLIYDPARRQTAAAKLLPLVNDWLIN